MSAASRAMCLATDGFRDAMRRAGIAPPSAVVADGRLHRFHVEGDRRGTRNAWYVLHADRPTSGAFGSWRTGASGTWTAAGRARQMTARDRDILLRRALAARASARAERAREHSVAAERARLIWTGARPAPADHPYLVRKGIPPGVARVRGAALVLPIVDLAGRIWSLQFIQPDGRKKLLAGGRKHGRVIPAGAGALARSMAAGASGVSGPGAPSLAPGGPVILCEGWATGQTLALLEPGAEVLAAVDAGNLPPAASAARCAWPHAAFTIAADRDAVGIARGRAAALACSGTLAIPRFPEGVAGTDFNDLSAGPEGAPEGACA